MQEVGGTIISRPARGQSSLFALRIALLPCRYSAVVFIIPLLTLSHSLSLCAADRGPPSRAGAPATLQAGDGEARPRPQLFLWAGRLQLQDPRDGAGARSQEAQAGSDGFIHLLVCFQPGG